MQDKSLDCKDCGNSFLFTVRDQQFYAEKGFENEPQRCRDCRNSRKTQRTQGAGPARELFDAICGQCGATASVPFKPRGDRPVLCRTCFASAAPARV